MSANGYMVEHLEMEIEDKAYDARLLANAILDAYNVAGEVKEIKLMYQSVEPLIREYSGDVRDG